MDLNALFPYDAMNTELMWGIKVWQVLIAALIIPYPVVLIVILFLFKDKVTSLVRNGISRVRSGLPHLTGEVGQGSSEGGSSYSSKDRGP